MRDLPRLYRIARRPRALVVAAATALALETAAAGAGPAALYAPLGLAATGLLIAAAARRGLPERGVWVLQLVEAALLGLLLVLVPLHGPACAALGHALLLSNAALGGPRLLAQAALSFLAGLAVPTLGGVAALRPEPTRAGILAAGGFVLGYGLLIALLAFRRALAQARARRRLGRLTDRLQRFLPAPLALRFLRGGRAPDVPAPVRRTLAFVVADLEGFTAFARARTPEAISAYLGRWQDLVLGTLGEGGATVDRFLGDGVLAWVGHPESSGPRADSRRALALALRLQRRMARLRAAGPADGGPGPAQRVAVHAGACVVGCFGAGDRFQYTALGHAVNETFRLQGHGPPGGVLASAATVRLAGARVFRVRGSVALRGLPQPVPVCSWHPAGARRLTLRTRGG